MNNNQGRRRTRRVRQQRKQKNTQISRILLTVCMIALVAVVSIGGTIAWLTDKTESVVNTFTQSDVDIVIGETGAAQGENNTLTKSFQMVPGKVIPKDPYVKVLADSEKSYVFVKIDKSANADTFLTYGIRNGWNPVTGVDNVYYRIVDKTTADTEPMYILDGDATNAGGIVTVKSGVTKAQMDVLSANTLPTLTFTAYAIQYENLTFDADVDTDEEKAAAAWALASNPNP